ncbi:acylphosphatase [Oscillatoria amoena NRMC-F 0135]|nr:acylphosphatase [Oscillatoria amoena NRMC-F 0135]
MKHLNLIVSGKVQGVFFRASTLKVALQLGVKGFVRNQPDGTVYIEAEGDHRELEQFVAWCRSGPPGAQVQQVEITESHVKHFRTFEIAV